MSADAGHTVLVNGEIILRDGKFTRVDEQAILDEIASAMDRPSSEEEIALRQMARTLMPHIKSFYHGYPDHQGVGLRDPM